MAGPRPAPFHFPGQTHRKANRHVRIARTTVNAMRTIVKTTKRRECRSMVREDSSKAFVASRVSRIASLSAPAGVYDVMSHHLRALSDDRRPASYHLPRRPGGIQCETTGSLKDVPPRFEEGDGFWKRIELL